MSDTILYQSVLQKLGQLNPTNLSKLDAFLSILIRQNTSATVSPGDLMIRERLHNKYVLTDQWQTMNLEEKEDASILETLLYLEETEQAVPLSLEEDADFKNEIKTWANL